MDRLSILEFIFVIITATACLGQLHSNPDQDNPCGTYKEINEPHRSTGFFTALPEKPLCDDRLRRGWYRFTNHAGGEMPTTCQETNRCGTTQPIWLDASNPKEEDGIVNAKICVNMNSSEPQKRACCEYSEDIFVKNCGQFYVYYLYPTVDCDMAYCAGSIPPCPVGKWSNTSFPPCKDPYPVLDTPPVVTGPDKQNSTFFGFQCKIKFDESDQDQRFEVVWTFNGKQDPLIGPQLLAGSERTATLDVNLLKSHGDANIACEVRSYYIGHEADKSTSVKSNTTYFGITTPPVFKGPIMPDNKTFIFNCEVFDDGYHPDQMFEVSWTFDGQQDPTLSPQIVTVRNKTVVLDGALIKGHLNTRIGCQARLTYPQSDIKTPFVNSNTYFAGIHLNPDQLELSEIDFEKYVTVTSTIPIACDLETDCCITFKLNVNATAGVSLLNSCEHKLCSSDWDPLLKTASIKIGVAPTRNTIVEDVKEALLSFVIVAPSSYGPYFNVFDGSKPSQVQIKVKDEATFKCSMTGDPHITGFDFKRYVYDLYKSGDYIAYVNQQRDFMIQIRTVPCARVACIYGIVVREGNDVIKILTRGAFVNDYYGPASIDIAYELSPGTIIQGSPDGYRWGIYLPSGSEVRVEHGTMDVFISLPAFDKGLGRGLCGTNDGIEDNDFMHPNGTVYPVCIPNPRCIPDAFLESWRVTGNDSLFEVVPDPINSTDQVSGSSTQYCSCLETSGGNSTVTCSPRQYSHTANTACPNCPVITNLLKPSYKVGVGWVKPGTDKPDPPFVHPEVKPVEANQQWPNDKGVTEAQARDLCRNAMEKSQLYLYCQNMAQLKNAIISDCLADILYGGTTDFLDDITSSFTSKCQLALAQNPDNYVTNGDGAQVIKPEILNVCPTECFKHGQCDKGRCICQDGFEGETCLIESGKGPQLVGIQGGVVCDVTQRACNKINTDVTNINFLDQLQVSVQEIDEQNNKVGSPVMSKAVFLSPNTITATIPALGQSSQRYRISATKNGTLFGNELTYTVFDGTCLVCTDTGCTAKSTACHIDKICYRNGVADPSGGNRTCDVSKSTSSWTTQGSERDAPELTSSPILTGPSKHVNGSIGFQCEVIYDSYDPEQIFEVIWTFNGLSYPRFPPQFLTGQERNATLDIMLLKGQVDTNIGCKVRSYYKGSEIKKSDFVTSNTTYFGIQTPPVLTGPFTADKSFIFQCEVTYNQTDSSQEIEVAWTFDGQQDPLIPPQVISGSERIFFLDGGLLMGHLSSRICCEARLTFSEQEVNTTYRGSNTFFAGIQIQPDPLAFSENDLQRYITVTSTIPIICDLDHDCCLTFTLNVNETSVMTLLNSCSYKLCSSDWDSHLKKASIQIGVMLSKNFRVQNNKPVYLAFDVTPSSDSSPYLSIFQNYKPVVQVISKDRLQCSIYTDPHLKLFDFPGSDVFVRSGDYIAFVARAINMMIQVRVVPVGSGSWVCGVIVRDNNDIIKVSKCETGIPIVTTAYNLSPGTIIQRSSDGNRFGIHLASGVDVKLERGGTNVYISIPAYYPGLGRGLCGTNDGIATNDFTHPDGTVDQNANLAFYESWRVTGNESLFQVVPDPINSTDSTNQTCTCLQKPGGNSTVICSSRQPVYSPSFVCPNCLVISDLLSPSYLVGVGWVTPGTNQPEPPFIHPEVNSTDTNKQWPNDQGTTEAQARDLCREAVQKSQLYTQCQSMEQLKDTLISDCMFDILYGSTTEYIDDITATFTSQCQLVLAQNPDNYVTNTDGELVLKPELLEDICPVECMKHGQCGEKGKCVCQQGWEGETCLIQSGKGPHLLGIKSGSKCDISQTSCSNIHVDVTNINFPDKLLCGVQEVDEQGNEIGTVILITAVFFSPTTIICTLPAHDQSLRMYNISATKDGVLFGNRLPYKIYDGTCLDCLLDDCKKKVTSCHIDNVCYKDGELDKNDANKVCDVTISTSEWTIKHAIQTTVAPEIIYPTRPRDETLKPCAFCVGG